MIRPTAKVVNQIRRMWPTRTRVIDIAKEVGVSTNTINKWRSAGWLGDLEPRTAGVKPNKRVPTGSVLDGALALWDEYGDKDATARAMGVSYDTLLKWERRGLLTLPDRGGRKRKRIMKAKLPNTLCLQGHKVNGGITVRLCSTCVHLADPNCKYYVTSVEQQLYGLQPHEVWGKEMKSG